MAERSLPVPGYEGHYEVTDHGRVISLKHGKRRSMAGAPNSFGYPHVILCRDGSRDHRTVHALVMEAFVGLPPEGMEVRHLDGDPANNHLTNLRYGSRSENMQDKARHGNNYQTNKARCPAGHTYDDENTYVSPTGHRKCRACHRERARAYRRRAKEAA